MSVTSEHKISSYGFSHYTIGGDSFIIRYHRTCSVFSFFGAVFLQPLVRLLLTASEFHLKSGQILNFSAPEHHVFAASESLAEDL